MKSSVLLLTLFFHATVFCQGRVETKIERFPGGTPRAEYSFYRADNGTEVWHGKRTEWNQDGRKFSEGVYVDGKAEGRRTYWHENGRKSAEGNYRDNKPEGIWSKWYPDGQLQEKCAYEDGLKHGTCMYWSVMSREVDIVRYINGKPLAVVEWEKLNVGKHKEPIYLYPYIVAHPYKLTFTSNYAGITKEFSVEELEQVFVSLPKSVWVNGREIGLTSVNSASLEEKKLSGEMSKTVEKFFLSKGYRVSLLPR